jgi:uncharacterized membrane protein YgdD (TMEM256/DUF423 family)
MNINKQYISKYLMVFVGLSGAFSVLFGAWLAHAGIHLPMLSQTRLKTALNYQLIHTLALFMVLLWYKISPRNLILAAAILFVFGIVAFSGSLYIKTFFIIEFIGKFAPFGGLSMALAWLLVAIAGKKYL